MFEKFSVEGFQEFITLAEEKKKAGKPIFVIFSGSKNQATGESWCPDCVIATPIIQSALECYKDLDATCIYCSVGPRDYWKDKNNEFRKDPRTKLTSVPTLLKFGSSQRLVESQCAKLDMVKMLFEDE